MTTPVDIVRGYLDAFATGDPEAMASRVSDDFVNEHLSELGSGCTGKAEYLSRLRNFLDTFERCTYTVEDVVEQCHDDASAAVAVVVRYTFTADFEGTRIRIPGVMWFTVSGGQITRRTDLWDSLTFLRQTGQSE